MRLMRLSDVPRTERDHVFRYSQVRAATFSLAAFGTVAFLLCLAWTRHSGLAAYLAAVIVLGMIVMRRFILARFLPSNWLVRMSDGGLFVQFRSYLNSHFPADDLTVVFIPHSEVRSARRVTERRNRAFGPLRAKACITISAPGSAGVGVARWLRISNPFGWS